MKDSLEIQLDNALKKWDTAEVLNLYNQGAALDKYTIIGISNISGEWSGNVAASAKSFMHNNPNTYALPIEMNQVRNEEFIKKFSGFINPGAGDNFPFYEKFNLEVLLPEEMLDMEKLYQEIIYTSNKHHIPYLGICSGSQHLTLNHKGSLSYGYKTYSNGENKAEFLYGTIPYFMTLSKEEQTEALDQCVFPEVTFNSIYLEHSYSSVRDEIEEVNLGAISNRGIVMAHSKGTTQIGVQFHPENKYYSSPTEDINRQKEFMDNFFTLCQEHNQLTNLAKEKGLSDKELFRRMSIYDLAVISRLQICAQQGISPFVKANNPFLLEAQYGTCKAPSSLPKDYSYTKMLDDANYKLLQDINPATKMEKLTAFNLLSNEEGLEHFLQADNHDKKTQKLFLELDESLSFESKEIILLKFNELSLLGESLKEYALLRIIKAERMDVAKNIIYQDPSMLSSRIIKIIKPAQVDRFISNLDSKLNLFIAININDESLIKKMLYTALQDNNKKIFNTLLPKIKDQEYLADLLYRSVNNWPEFFDALLEVTDKNHLYEALYKTDSRHPELFNKLIAKTTNQDYLSIELNKAINDNDKKLFNSIYPRVNYNSKSPYNLEIALYKTVEHNRPEFFDLLLPKITSQSHLNKIATKIIKQNNFSKAFKVIDKITGNDSLKDFANKFIENKEFEYASKVIKKITNNSFLNDFADKFIIINEFESASKVIERIKNPTKKQTQYLKDNTPKKKASSDWLSLPVSEAIDESSYRKIDSDYIITEAEKLDHLKIKEAQHSAPIDYQSFINQYNPQAKLPEVNMPKNTDLSADLKLPETDMNAVVVIAARAAKFFVNKLTAGKQKETQKKIVKKQKKNKDITR